MIAYASGDKTHQARHTTISEHRQHIIRHQIRFTDKSYATFRCIRSFSRLALLSAILAAISGSSPETADAKHALQLSQLLPSQPPAGSTSLAADVPCSALWASISARVHNVGPDDDGAVFSLTTAISITSGSGTGVDCAAALCCGASVMAGASVPDCCTPAGACGASAVALAAIVAAAGAS